MKLQNEPFLKIENLEKTIELRLNDEKRKMLKPHDFILFTNISSGKTCLARIIKIHEFDSFKTLYETLDLEKCGYSKSEVANAYYKYM